MVWVFFLVACVVFAGLSVFFGAPYLPSHRRDIRRMFDNLITLTPSDTVLDIGSGDGIVLREVNQRGAKAIGYEIHPLFVGISKLLSYRDKAVSIRWVNAWTAPFPPEVTLVYIFSVGRDGKRIIRKLQDEANRGNRIIPLVCYGNPLPGVYPTKTFEAYSLYHFKPLHPVKA